MSHTVLHLKVKTARKQYGCFASEWIVEGGIRDLANDMNLTFAEKRSLVKMMQERYKIYPGDKYYEQVGIQDGDFYCMQARIDAFDLCAKYDLWCE